MHTTTKLHKSRENGWDHQVDMNDHLSRWWQMIHLTLHKKWQVHWAMLMLSMQTRNNIFHSFMEENMIIIWNTYSAKVRERKEQNSITMIKTNFGSIAQSLLKSTEDLLVWWYILIGNDGSTWMTNWLICIKYLLSLLLKCPQTKMNVSTAYCSDKWQHSTSLSCPFAICYFHYLIVFASKQMQQLPNYDYN